MTIDTITPPTPAPAGVTVPTLSIVLGPSLENALLQLPEGDRVYLAIMLQDSIRENFVSVEQAQANVEALIRARLESLHSGKAMLQGNEGDRCLRIAGLRGSALSSGVPAMTVRTLDEAEIDLQSAARYLELKRSDVGARLLAEFGAVIGNLELFP